MGKLLLLLVLILAAFMALAVWLYNTLGVWGFVGAVAAFAVFVYSLKFLLVWGIQKAFLLPFKAKGAIMKDAQIEVHSITLTDAPPAESYDEDDEVDEEEDQWPEERDATDDKDDARGLARRMAEQEDAEDSWDEDDGEPSEEVPQDWYLVDATITPRPPQGGFRLWEPGELVLVPPDAKGGDLAGDGVGSVADIEIFSEGRWQADESYKYEGPLRLKMRVGVNRGTRRARFKYYFEVFGEALEFPAPLDV